MSNFNIYQFVVTAYLIIDQFKQWSLASGQHYGTIIYNKMIWCQLWHRHSSFVIHLAWWWWWYYACYTKYMTWFIFNWRNCLSFFVCAFANVWVLGAWIHIFISHLLIALNFQLSYFALGIALWYRHLYQT